MEGGELSLQWCNKMRGQEWAGRGSHSGGAKMERSEVFLSGGNDCPHPDVECTADD